MFVGIRSVIIEWSDNRPSLTRLPLWPVPITLACSWPAKGELLVLAVSNFTLLPIKIFAPFLSRSPVSVLLSARFVSSSLILMSLSLSMFLSSTNSSSDFSSILVINVTKTLFTWLQFTILFLIKSSVDSPKKVISFARSIFHRLGLIGRWSNLANRRSPN